jgi:hypothetical protein
VEEKSDWEQVEKVYRDQRMRAEALGLVELKLPPNVSIETPTPTFDFDASFKYALPFFMLIESLSNLYPITLVRPIQPMQYLNQRLLNRTMRTKSWRQSFRCR